MNVSEDKKEQLMRAYWLGALPIEQSETLETQWFSNDEDTELLEALRSELIQEYLSKNLTSAEKSDFEKNFLENNLEDVSIAKSYFDLEKKFVEVPTKIGFFEQLTVGLWSLLRAPQFAIALISVAILIPLLLFLLNSPQQPEIVKTNNTNLNGQENNNLVNKEIASPNSNNSEVNQKVNIEKIKPEGNQNTQKVLREKDKNVEKPVVKDTKAVKENLKESEPQKPVKPAEINSPVLYLSVTRGGEKTLTLSKETKNFSLKLNMPGLDKVYKSYEIRILDENNNLVIQQQLKENLSVKKSGEQINIRNLKTSGLKKNNSYKVTLVGVDEKKQTTQLNTYESFKVN